MSSLAVKRRPSPSQDGFALVEALFACAIFGLLVTAFVGVLAYAEQSSVVAGSQTRALFYG